MGCKVDITGIQKIENYFGKKARRKFEMRTRARGGILWSDEGKELIVSTMIRKQYIRPKSTIIFSLSGVSPTSPNQTPGDLSLGTRKDHHMLAPPAHTLYIS